jgi:hypothetical protein
MLDLRTFRAVRDEFETQWMTSVALEDLNQAANHGDLELLGVARRRYKNMHGRCSFRVKPPETRKALCRTLLRVFFVYVSRKP